MNFINLFKKFVIFLSFDMESAFCMQNIDIKTIKKPAIHLTRHEKSYIIYLIFLL